MFFYHDIKLEIHMKAKVGILASIFSLAIMANVAIAKPNLMPTIISPDDADKTIVIKDTTKHVNVFENETVLFKVGDKSFAIKFDGVNHVYDLATIAPPGMITHPVKVFVSANLIEHQQGLP